MSITIRFEDDGTLHNDLLVAVGGTERRCDTYYFALDQGVEPDREDAEKIRRVIARLLQQWIDALRLQREGEVVFLPFELSDEYTGCLECRRAGESVNVRLGWSRRQGWSFRASDISGYVRSVRDFQPYGGEPTRFDLAGLICILEQCVHAVGEE